MSRDLYLSPMFYGIEDHVAPNISKPFALRVYYPTDDDLLLGAPLLTGPHPLVIFAHGQRSSSTRPEMCPEEDYKNDHRWRPAELSSRSRRERGDQRIVEGCNLPYSSVFDEDAQA